MTNRSISAFLFGTLILTQATEAGDWLTQYKSGEEKLRLGVYAEAKRDLQAALASAESSQAGRAAVGAILDALGRTQFQSGQYRESTHSFERALQLWDQPVDRVAGLCNAGQAYREVGDYGRAEAYVREALALAPTEPRVWQLLGSVLIKRKRYQQAEAAERHSLSLGGTGIAASVWSDLAVIHEAQGKYEESEKALQRSIEITTPGRQRARMLANLGDVERKLGRFEDAVVHSRQGLEEMEAAVGPRHPDVATILEVHSTALRQAGRRPEAKQAAGRAREIRSLLAATVDWRDLK
jgi:tetratricopeptide (TPR) repeat protein